MELKHLYMQAKTTSSTFVQDCFSVFYIKICNPNIPKMLFQSKKLKKQQQQEFEAQLKSISKWAKRLSELDEQQYSSHLRQLANHCDNLLQMINQNESTSASVNGKPVGKTKPQCPSGQRFLGKLNKIITDHLEDDQFTLSDLCRKLMVSRTQLHRKIKSYTGLSITQYLNEFRLHKTKHLLETTNLHVSEVAYQVGFKNAEYFSRQFSKAFGLPPSAARNR